MYADCMHYIFFFKRSSWHRGTESFTDPTQRDRQTHAPVGPMMAVTDPAGASPFTSCRISLVAGGSPRCCFLPFVLSGMVSVTVHGTCVG